MHNAFERMLLPMTLLVAVACGGVGGATPTGEPGSPTVPAAADAATVTASPTPEEQVAETFPPGIWYREPRLSEPSGRIVSLDGHELIPGMDAPPGGFDLTTDLLVFPAGDDALRVVSPGGRGRTVRAVGLHAIARPSLSPGGSRVAVQASETPGGAFGTLHIYVIDLADGSWQRLSRLSYEANEESPEWFPGSNRIAFSSFSPEHGVNLHIVNLDDPGPELVFPDGGAIHLDVTLDGEFVLDPGRLKIYDTVRGDQFADLSFNVRDALAAAGYEIDSRFPGQANRGTFPLDGAFSPDAQVIVFDGAVKKDGEYGVILARVNIDGSDFQILTGLIPVNPEFSNLHNYSQLNPLWLDAE